MSGKLTTHVLNTAAGHPAAGMRITLSRFDEETEAFREIESFATNEDGRIHSPLLEDTAFTAGQYELLFHVGEYYRNEQDQPEDSLFLEQVPVRFTVNDSEAHYHVPLLVTPYGYTTYRGS